MAIYECKGNIVDRYYEMYEMCRTYCIINFSFLEKLIERIARIRS